MEVVGELGTIVRLDTGNWEREEADHLFEELNGIVAAKFIEDHLELHTTVLVNGRILVEFLSRQSAHEAFLGYILNIHLNTLTTAFHTFVRLREAAFGLGFCSGVYAQSTQNAEQRTSGARIAVVLYQVDIKHIQSHFLVLTRNSQDQ